MTKKRSGVKIGSIVKVTHKGRLAIARVISRNYLDGKYSWTVDILKQRVTFTDEQIAQHRRK